MHRTEPPLQQFTLRWGDSTQGSRPVCDVARDKGAEDKGEGRAITSAEAKALGLGGLREQQAAGVEGGRPGREEARAGSQPSRRWGDPWEVLRRGKA